jgi:uncharacterized protein YaiE (UPF0345 family)
MLKVHEYFDAKVKSIGYEAPQGPTSVGVMVPGEYTFSTGAPELMIVVDGALTVKLPGEQAWQTFAAGEQFNVPGKSAFDVKVEQPTAYLCKYIAA